MQIAMELPKENLLVNDSLTETKWNTFVYLLLAATIIPLVFFPFSVRFHHDAPSLIIISSFINFIGGTVHVGATGFFYVDASVQNFFKQHRWRYYYIPCLLTVVTGILYSIAGKNVAYIMMFYFAWQTYHYQKQNYGILSFIAAATDKIRPSFFEKCVLESSVWLGILGLLKIYNLTNDTFLQPFTTNIYDFAKYAFWIVPIFYLLSIIKNSLLLKNPLRLLFLALGGVFYLPTFLFTDSSSAILGYALGHGLQYIVFMFFVSSSKSDKDLRVIWLTMIALFGGCILALLGDQSIWLLGNKFIFGAYLGLIMAHFVIDAGIWKLRYPFQREYIKNAFTFVFNRRV